MGKTPSLQMFKSSYIKYEKAICQLYFEFLYKINIQKFRNFALENNLSALTVFLVLMFKVFGKIRCKEYQACACMSAFHMKNRNVSHTISSRNNFITLIILCGFIPKKVKQTLLNFHKWCFKNVFQLTLQIKKWKYISNLWLTILDFFFSPLWISFFKYNKIFSLLHTYNLSTIKNNFIIEAFFK